MVSLPTNQYGFPLVAVKEEVEDPEFHTSSSLHPFPTKQGTHAMMMASTSLRESASSSTTRGLPMRYSNAVFYDNRGPIYRHQSSTLPGAHPSQHAAATAYATTLHRIKTLASDLLRLIGLPARRFEFQDPISRSHHLSFDGRSGVLPSPHAAMSAAPASSLSNGDRRGNTNCCELFTLKLTQNDMQNSNWLIIPAETAKRSFPDVPYLMFWDQESQRWWSFQYCRSRDGQGYALVSGWSSFAKEKALETDDTLIFKLFMDNEILENSYYMIDVRRTGRKRQQIKIFGAVIDID